MSTLHWIFQECLQRIDVGHFPNRNARKLHVDYIELTSIYRFEVSCGRIPKLYQKLSLSTKHILQKMAHFTCITYFNQIATFCYSVNVPTRKHNCRSSFRTPWNFVKFPRNKIKVKSCLFFTSIDLRYWKNHNILLVLDMSKYSFLVSMVSKEFKVLFHYSMYLII